MEAGVGTHIDNVPQLKCSEDREDLDEESDAEENGNQGYQAWKATNLTSFV